MILFKAMQAEPRRAESAPGTFALDDGVASEAFKNLG